VKGSGEETKLRYKKEEETPKGQYFEKNGNSNLGRR